MENFVSIILLIYLTLTMGTIIKFRINGVAAQYLHVAFLLPVLFLVWAPISVAFTQENTFKRIVLEAFKNLQASWKYYPILVGSSAFRFANKTKKSYQVMGVVWPSYMDFIHKSNLNNRVKMI